MNGCVNGVILKNTNLMGHECSVGIFNDWGKSAVVIQEHDDLFAF